MAALAGAMTMDPEKLLWRPGAKLISIAPRVPNVGLFGIKYHHIRIDTGNFMGIERRLYEKIRQEEQVTVISIKHFRVPFSSSFDIKYASS